MTYLKQFSRMLSITCLVTHGSPTRLNLGPHVILNIHDLAPCLKSVDMSLYAEDSTITKCNSTPEDLDHYYQQTWDWLRANKLHHPVYTMSKDCDHTYVGQIRRSFKTGFKVHICR